jgi:hypothetical protein
LPYFRASVSYDYAFLWARGIEASGPTSLLDSEFSIVDGNKMVTVPKDAFTDRVICIEPTGNIYVQKGLGQVLRRRLRAAGVDLDDQTHNQRLARIGSITGSLCTIDLKSASDSVSIGLVKAVLPVRWYNCLTDLRSTCTRLPDGTWRLNEKFSSMGNGYTFELESLIFYAILKATCPADSVISAYGDDLVAPSDQYAAIVSNLEACGFTVNLSKSFYNGPFRESCGKHYFLGQDVTPIYQKKGLHGLEGLTLEAELYAACNRLIRWMRRIYGDSFDCDDCCGVCAETLRLILRSFIPRYRIPEGYGDGGLIANSYPFSVRRGVAQVKYLVSRAYTVYDPEYCYWAALRGPSDFTLGCVSVRRQPRYRVGCLKGLF